MHFSADNIDILDASLDGKNTFYATQVSASQRGPAAKTDILKNTQPSHEQLIVPVELTTTIPPKTLVSYPEQKYHNDVQLEWFTEGGDPNPHQVLAEAKDIVFQMKWRTEYPKRGWSQYNQQMSDRDPESTTIGYMPIILIPAREYDTLNTVIIRCWQTMKYCSAGSWNSSGRRITNFYFLDWVPYIHPWTSWRW